MTHHAGELHPR